jgi:hypothetical protein
MVMVSYRCLMPEGAPGRQQQERHYGPEDLGKVFMHIVVCDESRGVTLFSALIRMTDTERLGALFGVKDEDCVEREGDYVSAWLCRHVMFSLHVRLDVALIDASRGEVAGLLSSRMTIEHSAAPDTDAHCPMDDVEDEDEDLDVYLYSPEGDLLAATAAASCGGVGAGGSVIQAGLRVTLGARWRDPVPVRGVGLSFFVSDTSSGVLVEFQDEREVTAFLQGMAREVCWL